MIKILTLLLRPAAVFHTHDTKIHLRNFLIYFSHDSVGKV